MFQAPGLKHEEPGLGFKGTVSGFHEVVGWERREVRVE